MRISRYRKVRPQPIKVRFRANEWIRVPEVRVIDENGKHLGTLTRDEAMKTARERGYDLVEVNPNATPPVCKFVDYGQFKYQQEKLLKLQKAKVKEIEMKGVRLSLRIGEHDKELRKNQSLTFLEKGDKVRVEMILRGRERAHGALAAKIINDFIAEVNAARKVTVEQQVQRQMGKLTAIIANA